VAQHATLLETYLLRSDNRDPAARARAGKAVIAADASRAGRPGTLSCSRIRSASIPIASQTFSKLNGHERSVLAT
jgi:hypothetical protein